ncbi:MAG: hypothetical protein GXP56_05610 [Deltaproteobacteria bacterium]|nr:hypothetical protein [Deltaproteobacteria bacterium]
MAENPQINSSAMFKKAVARQNLISIFKILQVASMSKRTCECYTRSVRQLVDFYGKSPGKLSETQLQDYFLHRKNKDKWSAAALRICYSGIKFFFANVLKKN